MALPPVLPLPCRPEGQRHAGGAGACGAAGAAASRHQPRRRLAAQSLAVVAATCAAVWAFTDSAFALAPVPSPGPRRSQAARQKVRSAFARSAGNGHSEWRLGVGRAIDVLRADVTSLFDSRERPIDFSIFSEDVEVVDARLPSFRLRGLATYQRVLSTLRWSVSAACVGARLEITATSPPVNNEVYMRWRLHLWPRDPLENARGLFLAPLGGVGRGFSSGLPLLGAGLPLIVEGYSRYEFHPWTAEIVKHTIDITNPPMYLDEVIRSYVPVPAWLMPSRLGVPMGVVSGPLAAEEELWARQR